ncbi:MAG: DUF362 domain-containing protein [Candidatus Coatesbacteria bacterium]
MARATVAVVRATPETVLADVGRAMTLAGFERALPKGSPVILKVNITWHFWYPACNTTPWQLAGVAQALLGAGYPRESLVAAHNRTVVVSARLGERLNKHRIVTERMGIADVHLYEPGEEWVRYEPKAKMRVLGGMFPEGLMIPKRLIGANIIHLPTMKTHVFTGITGAMKNAFGGLLFEKRHWTHSVIHETLVDLLAIQKEIHPGVFAVMDGTFAGDGAGPRAMRWHEKDLILASADQVAIDAIAAKIMGFDPLSLKFIRLAHEAGLGVGDPREIEVVGEDIAGVNWGFRRGDTFASRGQKLIYWGPLHRFEKLLLRTIIVPWSYVASILYHDVFWYTLVGYWRARRALKTKWGRLFRDWERVQP